MELLTLHVSTGSEKGIAWLDARTRAMHPPPAIAGLRARSWRARRRAVVGRYLFDDSTSLEKFCRDMPRWDPPYGDLLKRKQITQKTLTITPQLVRTVFEQPVFILSAPRTGSTLLQETLSRCDELYFIDGEIQNIFDGIPALHLAAHDFDSQCLKDTDADEHTALTLRACLLAELQNHRGEFYLDHLDLKQPRPIRIIEKTIENALRIPFIRRVFPDAKFIYMYRDLRQNVSSMVEAWQHQNFIAIPNLPGWSRKHWCFLLPQGWQRFNEASLTHIASFQWSEANRAIVHELEAMNDNQWMTLTYANLLAAPASEISRVCDFIGVTPPTLPAGSLEKTLPLSATTITPPSPIKWRSNRAFDHTIVKGLQPLAGRMRNLRVNAAPPVRRATHATSTRFACFVNRLNPSSPPDEVIVSPTLISQVGVSLPLELLHKARHHERFVQDHPMLWIEDAATGIWCPLWLQNHQSWLCSQLTPGAPPPPELTGKLRDQLFAGGALTSNALLQQRKDHGNQLVEQGRIALERDRFCALPKLLNGVLRGAVAGYYQTLIASGEWPYGDAQVKHRYGWHNERIAQFLHYQLVEIASKIAERALKPTYAFASAYQGGAQLDAHMDREQCDYTLSLLIDECSSDGNPWPLWFQAPDGQRQVKLTIGDAVFFRGCELPHWREAAPPDHHQINLLFHFVPSEWAGVMH